MNRCSARFGCCIVGRRGAGSRVRMRVSAALVGASGISSRWEESSSARAGSSAREREAEIVEEGLGGRVERRASRRLAMTDHFDPLPVLERLDDVRGHGDAADGFDFAAGHGLLIGDDRQCFHHRARIARRLFRRQPVEIIAVLADVPWNRQPLATCVSSTLRPVHSSFSSSRSFRTVSASSGGSNSFASCATATGSPATSNAASRMPLISASWSGRRRFGSVVLRQCVIVVHSLGRQRKARRPVELHVDGRVRFGLRDADQLLAREFQHAPERSRSGAAMSACSANSAVNSA